MHDPKLAQLLANEKEANELMKFKQMQIKGKHSIREILKSPLERRSED